MKPEESMYAIEVENLRKVYKQGKVEVEALRGVTFKVKKGELFGFLGPNGAGKTTTIMILTTLLEPTSGKALVAGHDVVKEKNEVRKRIGVVFQDPALDNYLTAYENLYIHAKLYGLKGKELEERVKEALTFVDLWEHKDRLVITFSGGMRRRLEIARALVHEPEVLFLDEPTTGLDPQSRAKVWDYIKGINKEKGVTVFLTTHYMDEADKLCERIAIIDKGKIIAEGSPEELKARVGKNVVIVETEREAPCIEKYKCEKAGNKLLISVEDVTKALIDIIEFYKPYGIIKLDVKKPTLDDVFLALTGKELREEGPEDFAKYVIRRMMMR